MRRLVSLLFVVWLLPVFAAPLDDANLTDFYTGESVSTSTFKGKVVYLDFWASWCKPCKRSFPFMNELLSKYDSSQFEIIAINMDEDPNDAAAFFGKSTCEF